jgi:hypothetical protein
MKYLIFTIATIDQVRPNDHFLGETEYSQASTLQCAIKHIPRVSNHIFTLKDSQPNESNLWTMEQEPSISYLLSPANIPGVFPKQFHLRFQK